MNRILKMAVYHEKQSLWRCGIHAINNVLQARQVDQSMMDAACAELVANAPQETAPSSLSTWIWHPHRAPLGLGNYDVNVLVLVLQKRGYTMHWTDKRIALSADTLDFTAIEGVLCNIVTFGGVFGVLEQRHWLAIRQINGVCWNLDSKLSAPVAFASADLCRQFLQELVDTGECELFTITRSKEDVHVAPSAETTLG